MKISTFSSWKAFVALAVGAGISAAYISAGQVSRPDRPAPFSVKPSSEQPALSLPPPVISPQDMNTMAAFRQAGLHGDRSLTPKMIAALKGDAHPDLVMTAVHALAQLGATEALPEIDGATVNNKRYPYLADYGQVSKERLLAEDSAKSIAPSKSRAAVKVDVFLQKMGLTGKGIGAAVATHYRTGTHGSGPQPLEVYTMREIADMIYVGQPNDFSALPTVAQIDSQQDYASALKVKVAAMAPKDRAAWLIQDLAHRRVLGTDYYYEAQLAEDQGLAAGRAAAAQMREMDSHRSQYTPADFRAMFDILRAVGDTEDLAPLYQHFKHDADPEVAYAANYGFCLKNNQFAPGY